MNILKKTNKKNKENKIANYFLLFLSTFSFLILVSFIIATFTYSNNADDKKLYNEKLKISNNIERNQVFNITENKEYLVDFDYYIEEINKQKILNENIKIPQIVKKDNSYLNEMIKNSMFFIKKKLNTESFIVTDLNGNIASFYKYSKNQEGYYQLKYNDYNINYTKNKSVYKIEDKNKITENKKIYNFFIKESYRNGNNKYYSWRIVNDYRNDNKKEIFFNLKKDFNLFKISGTENFLFKDDYNKKIITVEYSNLNTKGFNYIKYLILPLNKKLIKIHEQKIKQFYFLLFVSSIFSLFLFIFSLKKIMKKEIKEIKEIKSSKKIIKL